MSKRDMHIVFSSKISALTAQNSSFDSGILHICYAGKNRNNSFISKDTFERCMPSIYNCPIVCHYDRETDTIGAHDMELATDNDGGMRIVNITHPVGIVPQDARYWWEEVEDTSGIHEYLCVEVLLWKRQEAYRKIKENGITEESMEISVKEGEMIDGVYVIKQFEFTAFCLLGTAQPCYESASLELFSHDDFRAQFTQMMQEFKETFALDKHLTQSNKHNQTQPEGGSPILKEKLALIEEYGLNAEQFHFSPEDFTLEELRAKLEEITASETKTQGNFALAEQFREELINALSAETVETCFGTMTRYWYVDHDTQAAEVYCYDTEDWKLYGFPYSMNGDNVTVHFADKQRKKFSIVDFDEGEQTAAFAAVFEVVSEKLNASNAQWQQKYQAATEKISSMECELDTLRKFQAETNAAAEKGERDKVFAQFEDLIGIEAFEALREQCLDFSVEDLEEKCYAIRGRNGIPAKFSQEPKPPKLPIEKTAAFSQEPYGGIFAEYGFPVKQQ